LEKWLAASLVLSKGQRIELEHLPVRVRSTGSTPNAEPVGRPNPKESELRKREELLGLLRAHEGNVSAVARALGKARPQVQRWLKRYGIARGGNRR
jgi:transcriptional regulator of acetoin/glycerol metabolism